MFLPIEVNFHIISFFPSKPELITSHEITYCARQFVKIALVNREFQQICSEKLVVLKKINSLVNKYKIYNFCYQKIWEIWKGIRQNTGFIGCDPKGNPQLLDALFSGCIDKGLCSHKEYNQQIEQDIEDIVKLTPQSLNCNFGTLNILGNRKIYNVTPLAVACINHHIPLHILKFLLQNGANPNATLNQDDGKSVHIFEILISDNVVMDPERLVCIADLFSLYCAV